MIFVRLIACAENQAQDGNGSRADCIRLRSVTAERNNPFTQET